VGLERSTVLFRDPSSAGRRFIPVLLAECKLPDTLRRYKYVDLRRESEAAFEELLAACRGEEERRSAKAPTGSSKLLKRNKPAKDPGQVEPLAVLEKKIETKLFWACDLAISPDGHWLAAGQHREEVLILEIASGSQLAALKGHERHAAAVCISIDGKRIISGSDDGTLRVWDAKTYKHILSLKGHTASVTKVAALEGQRVLSASRDGRLRLWDIASGNCLQAIAGFSTQSSVSVSRDGKRAVSGGGVKIYLWNLDTWDILATLTGHSGMVNSVQIMPDGLYAVSGSDDKTVKVWDLQTGTCVGKLEGHQNDVHSIAVSPDGELIASTGFQDFTIRLWDWKSGTCLQILKIKSPNAPLSVAFSPDGSRLVAGTTHSTVYVYQVAGTRAAPPAELTRRYVNAKVVLIGESTVGKTTLAHRLISDRYVKADSTHGMNVWPLEVPLEKDETIEREVLLWDLAGQEDYRLIHRLYLEETALALLLINPQRDDPFAEAVDWLAALRADVAKLLIPTRLDVGGMKVSQRKIDRFLKDRGFLACLPTSAKSGDNCSDSANGRQPSKLKQLIARHIPWDRLPWTSTPRLLADMKTAVMEMRDKADIRLLRFAELAQRLEQALPKSKFGEADVRTAVTLLANHGLVRPFQFGDLVLLRPDLLNGYAGAIIRAARAHKDEIGCVTEESIYRADFDFTGVERLKHRPDEELLLRALVQTLLDCSLCIRENEGGEWLLVFPSQYSRDRDIPGHPEIFVSYTFMGELQTIYTTLVVRLWYSRTFGQKELWQNAAEFTTSKGDAAGIVFMKVGEGEGKLSVFFDTGVPDELKVVFIEFVHRHLEKYGRDLRRERRYVCSTCGEPVKDLEAVQKRMKAGKDFIFCHGCDEPVPFRDHIEERFGSDSVAQQVVAMDARATRELDTQALEQILIGHMTAICGEANQIFRELTKFDYGIDGEVEFKDNNGRASGRKIYVQLKSGASHLRTRKGDGKEVFDVKDPRHLDYWVSQPVEVYLVIRDAEETIRWMNVSRYLKARKDKASRQIVFDGERLDAPAVWRVRDGFFGR
jgi:WD40 repeat protein/signal recognition particle receptor subunit beta